MEQNRDPFLWSSLALCSLLLAIAPLRWLVNSWSDPSYQSNGAIYCIVLAGLVALSLKSSPPAGPLPIGRGFVLFVLAAGIRLLGQLLAINILSALALAVDVYAMAVLFRLEQRRFAISPLWLSVFFLFALPLGPILERVAGFPLQMISADLACGMLSPFFGDLICEGVRLQVNGADVLVDLPCSGATGLLLLVGLWSFLNVLYRPGLWSALLGLGLVNALSIVGNAVRISLLAGGLALQIDTMETVLHSAIGLATLGLSACAFFFLYRPKPSPRRARPRLPFRMPPAFRLPLVVISVIATLAIINAPKSPVDISSPVQTSALPTQLNGELQVPIALTETEEAYFTAYGGAAQKSQYGPLGLNIVRTSSPLRHLHAPETCLRGMGFEVKFLGTRFDPIPTSIYQATGPDGRDWIVAVSFVSTDGQIAPGVGEAIWSWLSGTSRVWQSVQRITPADLPDHLRQSYELAALSALDLN